MTITIDGPAGAGKSSVAQGVARKLGYVYVDSGAMYRAVAWLAMQAGLSVEDDSEAITRLAQTMQVEFRPTNGDQHLFVDDEDLEPRIRLPEVGALSSAVSAIPGVRAALLDTQRTLARETGVVMEGRDIGTVVLPDASLKIFLTASPEERARRRLEQLRDKHPELTLGQVLADQRERDMRDSNREVAPLRKADDAIEVNSDGMTLEQVIEHIVQLAEGADGR
ncbi:MAG: (d)CMP kinase [candidate division WS1 bacterium]|nr:(d)CMP kinase [candidate division WS1 bacterium]